MIEWHSSFSSAEKRTLGKNKTQTKEVIAYRKRPFSNKINLLTTSGTFYRNSKVLYMSEVQTPNSKLYRKKEFNFENRKRDKEKAK